MSIRRTLNNYREVSGSRWKRGSRSRSGQRFAPPPWAADCPPRHREPLSVGAALSSRRGGERRGFPKRRSAGIRSSKGLTHLPAKAPSSPGGRCSAPENALEGERSMVLQRAVCGEAVERSADRRRAVDSSPLHTREEGAARPYPFGTSSSFGASSSDPCSAGPSAAGPSCPGSSWVGTPPA